MLSTDDFDDDRKRILVIDGYGFRALGPLYVIDKLVQSASKRAKKPLLPCDLFDLICGTSSGALVAILLGRFGLDCNRAIAEYKHLVKACCGDDEDRFWDDTLTGRQANTASYVAALSALMAKYSPGSEPNPEMLISEKSAAKTTNASHPLFYLLTCAVVISAGPDFSNRARCIRSYQGPKTWPPGHRWTALEAAQAASSTPFYLSPLLIDNKYGFRDASFSGFNNPINLAKNEHKILWPNQSKVLIVSIGTDIGSLVPDSVGKDWEAWSVTEHYSAPFADAIIAKIKGLPTDSHRRSATYIAQNILSTAAETRAAHLQYGDLKVPQELYYRIDPPLGLDKVSLVDFFDEHSVRDSVNVWAKGDKIISNISSLLVEKVSEANPEDLRKMDPPVPSEGTVNPGYHPQLDKRRPENVMDYLRNYRVVFIIDDSNSMRGELWDEAREALSGIAEHALKFNTHEISIAFFNSKRVFSGTDVQGEDAIRKIFTKEISTSKGTPTEATLERQLSVQLRKLNEAIGLPGYAQVRPLDIIVLTDGKPDDEPKNPILAATKEIREKKHHPNSIGIQFVQIGNDPKAKNALKELAYTEEVGMVDTVLYESYRGGKMNPEVLERILLGGLHPNLRTLLREKFVTVYYITTARTDTHAHPRGRGGAMNFA